MSYQDDNDRNAPPPLPSSRQDDDDARYREEQTRYREQQPPKTGCSKGCMYGMAGCGCFSVVLLIIVGIGAWRAYEFAKSAFSTDPAVVRATTAEMADLNPPAGLEPKIKMNMMFAKMVLYQSADKNSRLTLVQIDKSLVQGKAQQAQFEQSITNSLENQEGPNRGRLDPVKSETRDIEIRGETRKVTFAEAKDSSDGKEFQIIKGSFEGKGGPVQFELQLPKEDYKEEDVLRFLGQIK